MNADRLLALYARIADAPDAVACLRRFVLNLAVRGKLVSQNAKERPAPELITLTAKSKADQANLPQGWRKVSIGSIFNFQYGKGLKASERLNEGLVPVFGSNGIVGFTDKTLTDRPAIIVGRKGSAGALKLCAGPSWTTDVAYFVEAPLFFELRFALNAFAALDLDKLGKGVKPGLSRSDVYELEIACPPLLEQHRIVAKLDELMGLCDHLEAARAGREAVRDRLATASLARLAAPDSETFQADARFALDALPALTARPDQIKALRQTILDLAVRGKLVTQDEQDEPASDLLIRLAKQKASLVEAGVIPARKKSIRDRAWLKHELPENWLSSALGEVSNFVTSGSRGWAEFYSASGPAFIRAQNIRFGKMRLNDLAFVNPPPNSEGSRTQVAKGDLLIVITGAGVTNPALLDCDLGEAYVSQHVGLVRPSDTQLSTWLLLCLMASAGGRAELGPVSV